MNQPSQRPSALVQIRPRRLSDAPAGLTDQPDPLGWRFPSPPQPEVDLTVTAPPLARPLPPSNGFKRALRYMRTLREMIRRGEEVKQYPLHIQMESTDACNLHCTSCSRDMLVDRAKLLTRDQWKGVIDEVRPTNLNVSGIGEPFLHPDLLEIVRYARSQGAAVNCATNLTRVKEQHREIVESGFGQLKISIDAARPETYERIRGEDFHGLILENVREINRWKKELGCSTPSLRFNFALQRLNYEEAADLVDLAADHGVDGIYYQYLSYVDMEDRKLWLTADMTEQGLRTQLKEAERRAKKRGIVTNLDIWWRDWEWLTNNMRPMDRWEPNNKRCYFPWMSTWLGADGWVRPCPIMPWTLDEGRMGHVDEQSFAEIWNGPRYRALRAALARGERPTRSCKLCYPQDLYNIFQLKSKLLP